MPNDDTIPTISEIKGNTILQLLTNVYDTLKKAIFRKQNKLVAGDNIVIDDNTNRISAIVGGEPVLEDYYTKIETNALLDEKANAEDVYTKIETNALLNEKANAEDVYSKSTIDTMMADKENIISAGDNIEITTDGSNNKIIALKNNIVRTGTTQLTGNANITGNITVTGNITQNGQSYETHAQKIYTENDYIITRDGAEGALASGDYSGIEVEKYDGIKNCRLVVDNEGVARVGDTGDEQPLLTREESANLNNGECLVWDSANLKAITTQIPNAIDTALAGKQNTIININNSFSQNLSNAVPVFNLGFITAPKTGIMILSIAGSFGNNSQGYRLIGFSRNSTSVQENWIFNTNANSDALYFSVTHIIPVTEGDVIRACAYQTSGSTLGISGIIKGMIV